MGLCLYTVTQAFFCHGHSLMEFALGCQRQRLPMFTWTTTWNLSKDSAIAAVSALVHTPLLQLQPSLTGLLRAAWPHSQQIWKALRCSQWSRLYCQTLWILALTIFRWTVFRKLLCSLPNTDMKKTGYWLNKFIYTKHKKSNWCVSFQ